MKISRILFKETVYDPRSTRGADNSRSFYTSADGYDIDLDPASGIVTVRHHDSDRHNCVHLSNAKEWRMLEETDTIALVQAKPKFEMVKTAEGAFVMQPIKQLVVDDVKAGPGTGGGPRVPCAPIEVNDDVVVIPPRKRGRPKKSVAAQ